MMRRAFTMVELLCTIAIIAILAALLLPAIERASGHGKRVACASNLKQVGAAFHSWAHDHNDLFPMQVSTNQGGAREFADATGSNPDTSLTFRQFQAVSNELIIPKMLHCPADRSRTAANDFGSLGNSNISYWINVGASFGRPDSPLAGDRNVRTSGRIEWAFIQFGPNDGVEFTAELHGSRGNVLFCDGHVDSLDGGALRRAFASGSNNTDVTLTLPRQEIGDPVTAPANTDSPTGAGAGASSIGSADNTSSTNKDGNVNSQTNQGTQNASNDSRNARNAAPTKPRQNGDAVPASPPLIAGAANTSSLPRSVTSSSAARDQSQHVEVKNGNPIIEFARWLVRTATEHTYLLLLLLLIGLIAFELARRRAKRKRGRSDE